jgi:hypothetical protein
MTVGQREHFCPKSQSPDVRNDGVPWHKMGQFDEIVEVVVVESDGCESMGSGPNGESMAGESKNIEGALVISAFCKNFFYNFWRKLVQSNYRGHCLSVMFKLREIARRDR